MSRTPHQSTASTAADQQPSPSTNGSNGRGAFGRFNKGNVGGAGNPFARQVAALRSAFVRAVSEQDIDDIAMALIIRAKSGDVPAAKLLLAYCIGKPVDTVEPDRLDIDEWKLTQQTAAEPSEFTDALNRMPVQMASKLVAGALPAIGVGMGRMIKEKLLEIDVAQNGGQKAKRPAAAPSTNGHNGHAKNGRQRRDQRRAAQRDRDFVKEIEELLED
jgi:hypothetical protein